MPPTCHIENMATTVKADPKTANANTRVELSATTEGAQQPAKWQWDYFDPAKGSYESLTGVQAATTSHTPTAAGDWKYRATPIDPETDVPLEADRGETTVIVKPATEDPTVPLDFHSAFAMLSAVVLAVFVLLFIFVGKPWQLGISLSGEAQKADPRAALAGSVIGPVLTIGIVVLLTGLWMVLVEWRAAFKPVPAGGVTTRGGGVESFTDMLKAIATLKGSTLVFVGGLAVLFAVAWMTSAAAGVDTSSDTPSAAPSTASAAPATASSAPSAAASAARPTPSS